MIVGGYFIFWHSDSEENNENTDVTDEEMRAVSGRVTDVNLDQIAFDGPGMITIVDAAGDEYKIAVPSMGILLCAANERITSPWDIAMGDTVTVLGDRNENGEIVPCESAEHFLEVTTEYTDEETSYQFEYRKGPNGYVLEENQSEENELFISGVTLFNKAEYDEFQASDEAREGPASISVRVYENTELSSASIWTMNHEVETNSNLATNEPEEEVVGGANAVRFTADGLWPIDTYVVAHDSKMYVIAAMLPDGLDAREDDFEDIVESFEFVQ